MTNNYDDFFDVSLFEQEAERLTADPGGSKDFLKNFVKMPQQQGAVVVRILPAQKNQLFYCLTRTHRINGRSIHCPKTQVNGKWVGKCPICEYYTWLWQQADKCKEPNQSAAFIEEAKSIKPIERYYYNVIVRDNQETQQGEENGPLILSVGKLIHTKVILGITGNKELQEEPLGNICHPITGRDFKIIKKMKPGGQYPEYSDSKFLNVSPLFKDESKIDKVLEKRHDLLSLRKVMSESDLKRELRIHKGIEKDPNGGYNPDEYSIPSESTSTTFVGNYSPPKESHSSGSLDSKLNTSSDDDDTQLVDSNFMNELTADD